MHQLQSDLEGPYPAWDSAATANQEPAQVKRPQPMRLQNQTIPSWRAHAHGRANSALRLSSQHLPKCVELSLPHRTLILRNPEP